MKNWHVAFTVLDRQVLFIIKNGQREVKRKSVQLTVNNELADWEALRLTLRQAAGEEHESGDALTLYSDSNVLDKLEQPDLAPIILDPDHVQFPSGWQRGRLPLPENSATLETFFDCIRLLWAFWPGRWKTVKIEKARIQ